MGIGYTRNDTSNNIADSNVINASDLDGEFDAIESAFNASTGHTHDGTSAEGAPIEVLGPGQEVSITATTIEPAADNTIDLGTATKEFKDLYIDGTANLDTATIEALTCSATATFNGATIADLGTVTTVDINGGTVDGAIIGGVSAAAGTFTNVTASGTVNLTGATVSDLGTVTTADINGGTLDGTTIGATTPAAGTFTNVTASGTVNLTGATVSNLGTVTTADINGGTIDGATIGGTSAAAGTFTNLTASGTVNLTGATVSDGGTVTTVDINGGTIDGATIGGTLAGAGTFSSATVTGALNVSAGDFIYNTDVIWADNGTSTVTINKATPGSFSTTGFEVASNGLTSITRQSAVPLRLNRQLNDGTLISLNHASIEEGDISVSGATVSYNNFAGAHYSELSGAPANLLKGTIVEVTGQLVTERYHRSERLSKFKVSDTPDSKTVYGAILGPKYEEDRMYPDRASKKARAVEKSEGRNPVRRQYMISAVGAGHIRMNASSSFVIGDLVSSNGDGTGKVQADDIVRSSTIAKITSGTVIETYPDGSVLVPCVFYCG